MAFGVAQGINEFTPKNGIIRYLNHSMSFLCENSGDYRNPSLDEHFERALESVRKMCVDYAAHQTKHLTDECAALRAQMETVAKGSFDATEVMAEENRLLRDQLGQARADVAKIRAALQKLLPWCDKVPESVFDHAKDVLACTQDPPIVDATHKT